MTEKILFSDLKQEKEEQYEVIKINDIDIEVKQYLPVNDKLNLITDVLNSVASNDYSFPNPIQLDVYTTLGVIYNYAPDIEFSDEEKANPASLYDELEKQGIPNKIIGAIPPAEYQFVVDGIDETVKAYYNYLNSAKGIMEGIVEDYKNLDLDAQKIQKEIGDPNNLTLLKDVMEKLS